jgi:hypothetical protein
LAGVAVLQRGSDGVGSERMPAAQALSGSEMVATDQFPRERELTTMEAALWRDVPPTHIQVAGIAVRDSAIAELALLLSEDGNSTLAGYVGQTWDRCRPDMPLTERDCAEILNALEPAPPAGFQPLYEALRERIGATRLSKLIHELPAADASRFSGMVEP